MRWRRPYTHYIRYFQLKLKKESLLLLDVGCGVGELITQSLDLGVEAVGVDISRPTLLRSLNSVKSFSTNADAHFLPFRDSIFDVVCAFDLVEHLGKPEDFLKEAYRVLKNHGILVITTPSKKGKSIDFTHINEKKPNEWKNLLENLGFKTRLYYVPCLICLYISNFLKINAYHLQLKAKNIIVLEEPFRKILGIYFGKLKTRLYIMAQKFS